MTTLEIIGGVILALLSAVLIVAVLMQKGSTEGLSSVLGGGNTESFLGRNKTKTRGGKWVTITKVCLILIVIFAIALSVISSISNAA